MRNNIRTVIYIILIVVLILANIILYIQYNKSDEIINHVGDHTFELKTPIEDSLLVLRKNLTALIIQERKYKNRLDSLLKIPNDNIKIYVDAKLTNIQEEVNKLRRDNNLDSLNSRLASLENALMENPAKSLELPLLKIKLDDLKEEREKDMLAFKSDISNMYDFNKWFLALMGTMTVGVLTLLITNISPRKGSSIKETQTHNPT